ncbi:MAG TPA: FIST N-terminal domain-containing protein [Candidatus Udaeobacter sp.]|nr:FIST N-terminal domain-containing protein [Candidatus Udaeobacter sp.]
MIRVGVGQSSEASTLEAVENAAMEAMAQASVARADAAVIFFTVEHASRHGELIQTVRRITRTDQTIGCSAAGVLTSAGETEASQAVAVLVFSSDQIQSQAFLLNPVRERDQEVGAQIARKIVSNPGRESLLTLLPDTYHCQPRRLLGSIEESVGFMPIVGAGASENGMAQTTYQLSGDTLTSNAVAGLHLCGSFAASIDITQGCQPITESMVITKAEKNLIFEIDDRPAFEVFAQMLKGPLAEDLRRALMFVFVGLPADPEENTFGAGQYLVRNIIGLDPANGILAVGEEVREGQSMIFTLRDGQRARDDLNQMLERQRQNLGGKKPAFGLYFNCCARGNSLYGMPGIDTAYIRQALGDFPLIGMFGGYELAPLGGANHLFAYTGVLALITEEP